ncbi:MAG: single-stranded-DNA-specific exonuclease RecJ, partial [Bacillota bacterium]|nr:single-stranded-DNA-specific exonuclease RecJ [Bacillota bacterium]
MNTREWIYRGGAACAPFNMGESVARQLLARRGMEDPSEQEEFLSAKPRLAHDPFLMKDMDAAAERILRAMREEEPLCLYGDYDADGVTAVSLLLEILEKLGPRPDFYIPSRFDEGYGLNMQALESIRDRGARLVVTVDCGSVSRREVEYAQSLGLEVIVTDHHNPGEQGVDCLLVNPKQKDCAYPFKELCGCGVAFKLAEALRRKTEERPLPAAGGRPGRVVRQDLARVLDLAAIATIGDIVSLTGENRTIAKYGLAELNRGRRPGLAALAEAAGLKAGAVSAEDVAYIIVPHLNAAGRMGSADPCVALLTSRDREECRRLAALLAGNNRERKRVQEETLQRAEALAEAEEEEWFLLLDGGREFHEGIAGIVAGKLKDLYCRPVVLLTDSEDGLVKGTGRSVEGIDLYALIAPYKGLLEKFGGHQGACGFSLKRENLSALREGLQRDARRLRQEEPGLFRSSLPVEGDLLPEQVDGELAAELEALEPFGRDNPRPVFALRGVKVKELR